MKKSIQTFLKRPTKDTSNRSANPPVTRASTILFNSMQEMYNHELKIKKHKKRRIKKMDHLKRTKKSAKERLVTRRKKKFVKKNFVLS